MTARKPSARIAITYCSMCNWMLRSAWLGQELLSTFGQDLGEVALIPRTGGIFQIHYDGELIWDRKADGGFPDSKVLKQRVRVGEMDRAFGVLGRLGQPQGHAAISSLGP